MYFSSREKEKRIYALFFQIHETLEPVRISRALVTQEAHKPIRLLELLQFPQCVGVSKSSRKALAMRVCDIANRV